MTEDDTFVGSALARAAQLLPDQPDRPQQVRRARSARLRRRRGGAAGLTVVLLAAVGAGVAVTVHSSTRSTETVTVATPTPAPTPTAAGELGASGLVVAVPGRPVRFCDSDAPNDLELITPTPPPSDTCAGVDVVGVDLAALTDRAVQDGVVSGQAQLAGGYADGVLHVRQQGPPLADSSPAEVRIDHPPCPTPAGGWAVQAGNPDVTAAAAYQSAHPAQVQEFAVLRPAPDQALVYLLTYGDPAAARAALAADYAPDQLCVAQSSYSAAQLAAASADPVLTASVDGVVTSDGFGLDPATGQPVDEVSVVVATAAIRAAVARHPAGLVDISAWLGPVRHS